MMMQPTIEVASLGMWDSLILMVMALVVFGPRRLPEIGRQIGKLMYEVRKASNDFKFQMEDELRKAEDAERQKKEEARVAALALTAPAETLAGTDSSSQPSEAGYGAFTSDSSPRVQEAGTEPYDAFDVPSPYPGERVYPDVSPAEFEHPGTNPRIQIPSTGEPVMAVQPGDRIAQMEALATNEADAGAGEVSTEAPAVEIVPDSGSETEHAHHG